MTVIEEFAPAKVNLTLHVLGRREDGYHLLESLIAFADVGDVVTATKSGHFSIRVDGPFSDDLPPAGDNIVIAAAEALAHGASDIPPGAEITLTKNLPVASGIGGGSANAAACIRALLRLNDASMSDTALNQIAVGLGADVPVCLHSKVSLVSGIGQVVEPAPALPEVYVVLVNPRVAVPTGPVFQALGLLQGVVASEPAPPPTRTDFRSAETLADYLRECRNDLEPPAAAQVREIGDVEDALFAASGCLMARMSGSGATCFGLFADGAEAKAASDAIGRNHPGWWVTAGRLS